MIKKLPPTANPIIAHRIKEKKFGSDVYGMEQQHKELGNIIAVALNTVNENGSIETNPDIAGTVNHEAIHFLKKHGFISKREWRILTSTKALSMLHDKAATLRKYRDLDQAKQLEELAADAFKDWRRGRLAGETKFLSNLFGRVSRFFERLGNFLRGRGFNAVEDIYQKIASGEVGKRATQKGGLSDSGPMYQRQAAAVHSFAVPNEDVWGYLSNMNVALVDRLRETRMYTSLSSDQAVVPRIRTLC